MPITRASRHNAPITVAFLICTLILFSPLSFVQGSRSSPYDSGYDHGCDDAGISDPSDRYTNQDEKGPSYHTDAFNNGYDAGFEACSGSSDETEYEDESETQQPIQNDRANKISEMCTAIMNGEYKLADAIALYLTGGSLNAAARALCTGWQIGESLESLESQGQ